MHMRTVAVRICPMFVDSFLAWSWYLSKTFLQPIGLQIMKNWKPWGMSSLDTTLNGRRSPARYPTYRHNCRFWTTRKGRSWEMRRHSNARCCHSAGCQRMSCAKSSLRVFRQDGTQQCQIRKRLSSWLRYPVQREKLLSQLRRFGQPFISHLKFRTGIHIVKHPY